MECGHSRGNIAVSVSSTVGTSVDMEYALSLFSLSHSLYFLPQSYSSDRQSVICAGFERFDVRRGWCRSACFCFCLCFCLSVFSPVSVYAAVAFLWLISALQARESVSKVRAGLMKPSSSRLMMTMRVISFVFSFFFFFSSFSAALEQSSTMA